MNWKGISFMVLFLTHCVGLQATVVFQDNFNDDPIGGGPSNPPWNHRFGLPPEEITVTEDTSNLFGEGASNRYVRHYSPSNGAIYLGAIDAFPASDILTFSFDFYEPSSTVLIDKCRLYLLRENATIHALHYVHIFWLDDGYVPGPGTWVNAYTLDNAHHGDFVVNNSALALTYKGGTETLDPYSSDIWIDGQLIVEDIQRLQPGAIRGLTFDIGPTDRQEFLFDNITVRNDAFVIPGPATIFLLGLGGLAVLRRRKRN